ncbi:hypothetical protein JCM14469_18310 [Desulfatiferula olefinivorans]
MVLIDRAIRLMVVLFYVLSPSVAFAAGGYDYLTPDERDWLKAHPVIRLGVGVAFPPFQWVDKDGDREQFKGMVADYVRLMENRLGVELRVTYGLTFEQALAKGRSKDIDLFPFLSKTEERSRFLLFSEPYLTYPVVIVTRTDSPPISDVEGLNGKKVALVTSLMVYSTLENRYPHLNISYLETKTVGENLDMVSLGHADACIVNLAVAAYLISAKGLTNLTVSEALPWETTRYTMGIRSDWPELQTIINKTLARISFEEKDVISRRWIKIGYPAGIALNKVMWWGGGIGCAVLAAFGLFYAWNRRLQAEIRERKRAEAETRESEARYRALFESAGDAIYILDNDTYVEANPKGLAMLGGREEDIIGKTPFDFSPETQAGGPSGELGRVFLERTLKGEPTSFEWVHQRPDGTLFHSDISLSRIALRGRYHVLAIGRDISEKKALQKEKEELEDQLRQARKMEAIGTLSGGIAHDFNNILGIILGNAELASDSVSPDHPAHPYLSEIRKAGMRATEVVSQLLSFSRKSERSKRPIDLVACVNESVDLMRATLPSSVVIQRSIREPSATILGDAVQIQQVLINLCTNAAHAMEPSGGSLEIDVAAVMREEATKDEPGAEVSRRFVRIMVRDTGHGISPDIKDRIFDPYFTTKEVGKGSGLGLSVAHGIVSDHGGSITVTSEPDQGCTVEVFFPLIDALCEAEPDEPSVPAGKGERILLVDDEASLMAMSRIMLTRLGYRVEGESRPESALAIFRSDPGRFDLVITDMTMPGMSGEQLVRHIRDIRPDIPVILITGFSDHIDRQKAEALGINGYLEKPVRRDVMAATILHALNPS